MSDANTTSVRYATEETYGVNFSPLNLTELRLTGESFSHAKDTVLSAELRADRQRGSLVQVGAMGSGSLNFEFSVDSYILFIEAALGNLFFSGSSTVTATASALAQTVTATVSDFASMPVGGFIKLAGFATPANNGLKRVLAKSVDNLTLTLAAGSITAAEVAVAGVTGTASQCRNGTLKRYFTLEREITNPDGVKHYQHYKGMSVDEWTLEVASKAIVTGAFTFMGQRGFTSRTSLNSANGSFASGVLTVGATDPANNDTITIGSRVYTLKTVLGLTANEILISGTPNTMAQNIRNAVTGDVASYGVSHRAAAGHAYVSVTNLAADATVEIQSVTMGVAGNFLVTTTTAAGGALSWAGAVLAGGVDPDPIAVEGTSPVLNGTTNVGVIYQGTRVATNKFKAFSMGVKNNLRAKDALGVLGVCEIGWGTIDVTGKLESYFRDNDLYESIIDHEYTALAFILTAEDGKQLCITLPHVSLTTGDPNATAINTDVMMSPAFTAVMHPTYLSTIIVDLFLP